MICELVVDAMVSLSSAWKYPDRNKSSRNSSPFNPVYHAVVMYGCESWTIKKAEHQRNDAFELWCWR